MEPPRIGEDASECPKCHAPDDAYIWVNENWRVRSLERPSGLPMVLILECRSHLDLGDLPNMLAAELGVMTVRLERAIRSIDDVARVHVNRWGDGMAHLHLWFMARPYGRIQLRGTFLTLWDEILPPIPEHQWQENLALVAAWLAEFGGEPLAKPPRIDWKAPSSFEQMLSFSGDLEGSEETSRSDETSGPHGAGSPDETAGAGPAASIGPAASAGAAAGNDPAHANGSEPTGADAPGAAKPVPPAGSAAVAGARDHLHHAGTVDHASTPAGPPRGAADPEPAPVDQS